MPEQQIINCNASYLIYSCVYICVYIIFICVYYKCSSCLIVVHFVFGLPIVFYVSNNCCLSSDELPRESHNEIPPLYIINEISSATISPEIINDIENIPDIDVPPSPNNVEPKLTISVNNLNQYYSDDEESVYSPMNSPNKKIECAICLSNSPKNMRMLRCKHSFHNNCIKEWMKKEPLCPLCRDTL